MAPTRQLLLVPGFGNSGPGHWQTLWEEHVPGARRVELGDWDQPSRDDWIARLDPIVRTCPQAPVLVAHSLGVIAVASWACTFVRPVHAALLVAPPDMSHAALPPEVRRFGHAPLARLGFRAILAVSSNDPYCDVAHARALASAWQVELIELGDAGHVNAASGHGPWPEGLQLLAELSR